MKPYRLLLMFVCVFAHGQAPAQDDSYLELNLSSPRAAVITYLGSLQSGNCHHDIAAQLFLQKGRTEKEAIDLAVQLKSILDDKAIQIDIMQVPDDHNYIDPKYKFHRYQLTQDLPKVYLVKVKGQWRYSEATAQYVKSFYQQNYALGKQRLLKLLPAFTKRKIIFNLYLWQVIAILIGLLFVVSAYQVLVSLSKQMLRRFATKGKDSYDQIDALAGPLSVMLLILLFRLIIFHLALPLPVYNTLFEYIRSLLNFIIMILCYRLVEVAAAYMHQKTIEKKIDFNLVLLPMAKVTLRVLIVIVGLLFTLQSLRFDIKGLLTGVGIGGLGFALASQDTIKNFFGSLVILTDKPFDVGDFIVSGNIDGKVEEIGFRSTRIRTSQGSTIYVPNGKLSDSHINNHGLRQYKGFTTSIAIAYNTPLVVIETFIEGLQKLAAHHPSTREGKYFVALYDIQASVLAIKFEVKFNVTDYATELQSRHELLSGIIKLAESLSIPLSFPTQTLHMETFPEKKPAIPQYTTDPVRLKERLQNFLANQQAPE